MSRFPTPFGAPNPHAAARLALARQLGAGYAANKKAVVIMAAGSTGRGTADEFSDLELDVYWREPPTADERRAAALAGGADSVEVFPYEEEEWAEEMMVGGVKVATSTFLVRTVERYLGQVAVAGDPAPLAQIRLYAIQHALIIYGDETLVANWRERANAYPETLTRTMLYQNLAFEGFGGAEDALAARDDIVVLYDVLTRVTQQLLGALCGLNRVYLPNPGYKHVAELIDELPHKPTDLLGRLKGVYRRPPRDGVAELHALIREVYDLVDKRVPGFDTQPYRERLSYRRPLWPPIHTAD